MVALISLLVIITLSIVAVRIGAIALELTGLSPEIASFQAQSAFSGAGFTTSEAEVIVSHPVRRRIVRILILFGSAGLTTSIATLKSSELVEATNTGVVEVSNNIPTPPPAPTATPKPTPEPQPAQPQLPADQGCYLIQNHLDVELTITFTAQEWQWNETFVLPAYGEQVKCLSPGRYTYTIDAPPPWGVINGELVVNAGDQLLWPISGRH